MHGTRPPLRFGRPPGMLHLSAFQTRSALISINAVSVANGLWCQNGGGCAPAIGPTCTSGGGERPRSHKPLYIMKQVTHRVLALLLVQRERVRSWSSKDFVARTYELAQAENRCVATFRPVRNAGATRLV
jgi:hypothetical protein